MIDPRIAAYVAEVSAPGIPYVSTSHLTLHRLHQEHGAEVIQSLLNDHWASLRGAAHSQPSKDTP